MATKPISSTPSARTEASAPGARAGVDVWDGLAAELAELASLARRAESLDDFYPELLRRAVTALAAEGGAVWTTREAGRLQQVCVIDPDARPIDHKQREAHERLLRSVIANGEPRTFAPHSTSGEDASVGNSDSLVLVVVPVLVAHAEGLSPPAALLELSLRPGASPSVYQGALEFLAALADVAAEFHAYHDLARLRAVCEHQNKLLTLGERVHRDLNLKQTAGAIANEAREAIGCDRVSVLAPRGRGCRLLAVSGVDRPDRRSRTVRGLEKVAAISSRLGDPLYLADDQEESLPQAAEALHKYADTSNARQIAVVPMRVAANDDADSQELVGVLVAESFEGYAATVARDRVTEAARVCAPALRNAIDLDTTPMVGLLRSARGLKRPSTLFKGLLAAAIVATGAAALVFVPAELRIEARGELQPVVRRNVFAPGDGIVERVAVKHGQQVKQGELLATLRDPKLDLEIKRIDGERQTTLRQLDAVRATRTSLDQREASATDAYRLSAEEQQLKQRLATLDEQQQLLKDQREDLRIESPLDGMVVTWELDETLLGRPVQRGEVLLTIADTRSDWRVELELPDDRIGYVLDAQAEAKTEALPVEYRLGSQEEGFSTGVIQRIAQRAEEADPQAAPGAMKTVLVYVKPGEQVVEGAREGEVRPGASVRARVLCGQHPLGYVWMHDLINAARVWWEF